MHYNKNFEPIQTLSQIQQQCFSIKAIKSISSTFFCETIDYNFGLRETVYFYNPIDVLRAQMLQARLREIVTKTQKPLQEAPIPRTIWHLH